MKVWYSILASLLLLSLFLRIDLGIVNREQNDNHIELMARIRDERPTDINDCWQCYHAKLFHKTTLVINGFFGNDSTKSLTISGQLINTFFGILLLLVLIYFVLSQNWTDITKYSLIIILLFSPKLLTMHSQATNDTFVAFFSTFTFFSIWKWKTQKSKNRKYLWLILLYTSATLAALSKLSGVMTILISYTVTWGQITLALYRKKTESLSNLFLTLFLTVVSILFVLLYGPYYQHFQNHGSPFSINASPDPFPPLFKKDTTWRPGTLSVVDSLVTFKFMSMLRQPYVLNTFDTPYAPHRTSLWSMQYGQFISTHFEQWPKSWQNITPLMQWTTRILLVLGLPIPALGSYGLWTTIKNTIKIIRKKGFVMTFFSTHEWMYLVVTALFYLSLIRFVLIYREFTSMKFIYITPITLFLMYYVGQGLDNFLKKKHINSKVLGIWIFLLTLFSLIDIFVLISDLSKLT